MKKIAVWTKQNEKALKDLQATGRYTAKREYIEQDMKDQAPLILEVYDWLAKNCPIAPSKPPDVAYPVWVSPAKEATMLPSPGTVILELEIDPSKMARVNINKWGAILNYSYIPANDKDAKRHQELLSAYNTSDAQAYMSQFYPEIKREIQNSWHRLFDDTVTLGPSNAYGIIWEVKKEWLTNILQ